MHRMKPTLLILAAGMGSRYGGLKQIDPVGPNGEAIIDFSVFDAIRAGFGRLVFVIRRDIEDAFRETIGRRFEGRLPVSYAFQELDALPAGHTPPAGRSKPWGTGHAVLVAADLIHEPFAAINADDFYGPTSYRLLHEFLVHTPDAAVANYAMVGFRLANTLSEAGSVSRGVCRCDETGHLRHIEEITKLGKDPAGARYTDEAGESRVLPGDTLVSMNMWGFHTSFFAHLREGFAIFLARNGQDSRSEYYLPTAVNDLVNAGRARVRILSTPEAWCGVTYQQDRLQVINYLRGLVENGTYPSKLSP